MMVGNSSVSLVSADDSLESAKSDCLVSVQTTGLSVCTQTEAVNFLGDFNILVLVGERLEDWGLS